MRRECPVTETRGGGAGVWQPPSRDEVREWAPEVRCSRAPKAEVRESKAKATSAATGGMQPKHRSPRTRRVKNEKCVGGSRKDPGVQGRQLHS